jgi:hypothetical protein
MWSTNSEGIEADYWLKYPNEPFVGVALSQPASITGNAYYFV